MQMKVKEAVGETIGQLKSGILQIFSANVLNRFVAMVSNMVITRLMTAYDYGLYSYVLNIYSYLLMFNGLGLLAGAFQFGSENRNSPKEYSYFRYCLKTGLLLDGLFVFVSILGFSAMDLSVEGSAFYVKLYLPILLIDYAYNILLTLLRCENRIPQYAKVLNYNTIIAAIGTCAGAFFGITGIIIGRYLAHIVTLFHVWLNTKSEARLMIKAEKLEEVKKKELWHYSLFTGMSSALNTLLYLLDITMIAYMVDDLVSLAHYKVATLIPSSLAFIPLSVITAVLPRIIAHQKNKSWLKKNIRKLFQSIIVFNFVLCAGLIVFAPYVIGFISGREYLASVPYFRILVFGYFISGSFRSISTNLLAALKKVNLNLVISITSGVFDVILNVCLIRRFGTIGAAYATLGVIVITSIAAVFGLARCIRHIKTEENLDEREL